MIVEKANKYMIKLKGKIVLIDDDNYEKELLQSALKKEAGSLEWNILIMQTMLLNI